MHSNKQAFTLIELLVVVLIIGILAAVAVPQYQLAVWKSRYTQLITFVGPIHKAVLAYQLENGEYPSQFSQLGITLPGLSDRGQHTFQDIICNLQIQSEREGSPADSVNCYFNTSSGILRYRIIYPNNKRCQSSSSWVLGNNVCRAVSGLGAPDDFYGSMSSANLENVYSIQ